MDHLLVFDTETTGLGLDAGVCEVAWVEIDDDMNVLDKQRSLINPGVPISPAASGVHRITDDMVRDAPTLHDFLNGAIPGIGQKTVLMIAHNASFDAKFLKPHVGALETMCTLKLARQAWPESPDHKLSTLMFFLQLAIAGSHNALDDVMTCHGVLKLGCHKLGLTLEEAFYLLRKPREVTHMPFGKQHKGRLLTEVPTDYLKWCLTLENLDSDLRASIEKIMKKKRRA